MSKTLTTETVEQFIKRGGKIEKVEFKEPAKPVPFDFLLNWRKNQVRRKKKLTKKV